MGILCKEQYIRSLLYMPDIKYAKIWVEMCVCACVCVRARVSRCVHDLADILKGQCLV